MKAEMSRLKIRNEKFDDLMEFLHDRAKMKKFVLSGLISNRQKCYLNNLVLQKI